MNYRVSPVQFGFGLFESRRLRAVNLSPRRWKVWR